MITDCPPTLLLSLGAVADAATEEELATAVLGCVTGAVGVDSALVAKVGHLDPTVTNWSWPDGFFDGAIADHFEQLNRREPWVLATHTRICRGGPLRISDRLSRRALRALPIYSEILHPLEIDHQAAFSLPGGPSWSTCVAVNRGRRDFSDREVEWFELLRRPLSAVMAQAVDRLRSSDGGRHHDDPGLSAREAAVLLLVAEGHSNDQIGRRLGISVRTVEKHLEHVYAKTGARNRTDAAVRWLGGRPSPAVTAAAARAMTSCWVESTAVGSPSGAVGT